MFRELGKISLGKPSNLDWNNVNAFSNSIHYSSKNMSWNLSFHERNFVLPFRFSSLGKDLVWRSHSSVLHNFSNGEKNWLSIHPLPLQLERFYSTHAYMILLQHKLIPHIKKHLLVQNIQGDSFLFHKRRR